MSPQVDDVAETVGERTAPGQTDAESLGIAAKAKFLGSAKRFLPLGTPYEKVVLVLAIQTCVTKAKAQATFANGPVVSTTERPTILLVILNILSLTKLEFVNTGNRAISPTPP